MTYSPFVQYFANGLGSGSHTLSVIARGTGFLDLDSIVVYQATDGPSGTIENPNSDIGMHSPGTLQVHANGNHA